MSNLINKAKDALSSNKDHSSSTTHGGTGSAGAYDDPRSTNAGPHSSNLANKADPRIDSDRDNRNDPTSRVGGYGTQGAGAGIGVGLTSGTSGVTGTHGTLHGTTGADYDDPRSTNAGPHSSNLANKLDPRVDSDRDNRNDPTSRVGGYGTQDTYGSGTTTGGAGVGGYGTTGYGATGVHHGATGTTTSAGLGGTSGAQYDDPRSINAGPHSPNLANKIDPRVDSDRGNRNNPASSTGGYGQTQQTHGTGMTGGTSSAGYGTTGTTGTHGVGHGTAGTTGGYGTGTGATKDGNTTAQGVPSTQSAAHSSNLMNRIDPRVKADKEGNPLY